MAFELFHLVLPNMACFTSAKTFSFKNTLDKGPLSPHFLTSLLKNSAYTYMFPPELESAMSLF